MTVWIVAGVILLATGCHSRIETIQAANLTADSLFGSDLSSISYSADSNTIHIDYNEIPPTGMFIRFQTPDELKLSRQSWNNDSDILHLAISKPGFIDVGVAPLPSYNNSSVSLTIELASSGKLTTSPPVGPANQIQYFTAYQADAQEPDPNEVRLEWVELNTGDYDFNGEVNLADLLPLAKHIGETTDPADQDSRRYTTYWVDGDHNGEVNISDIQPIAANYLNSVDGYIVYHNDIALPHQDGGETTITRDEAVMRNSAINPLPPFYSLLLDGRVEDNWALAPADAEGSIGIRSIADPDRINDYEASGSLVISGVDLYDLEGELTGFYDSGYSLLRIILPGDDIDGIEIGDIIEGSGGRFSLKNIPRDTPLALEISYAPVLNLKTGAPFDASDEARNRQLSLSNMVVTRYPFTIPSSATTVSLKPRIDLLLRTPGQQASGYYIDVTADTSWDTGSISYLSRLDMFSGEVAANQVGDTNFTRRPWLADTDDDSISDAYIRRLRDLENHEGLGSSTVRYSGRVIAFNETNGVIVISNPFDMDLGMFAPVDELSFNFTEYVWLTDEVIPENFTPDGLPGSYIEIVGRELNGSPDGPALSYWASTINRTSL